ncbi:hypothetical protein LUZ63_015444 [Rhynchospora breviuscula]|uniref:RRM domain-containing protein n=1 Tax=Rhynchospora breviuscula TaxID=2022672 RepID=A0A9Q0HME8_9POAL|nr:hypothetical protein LUZ63_015444 [Rhynchospora breviuscula]
MVKKRKLAGGASTKAPAEEPKIKTELKEEPIEEAEPSAVVEQEPVEAEENNNGTNEESAMVEEKEDGAEEEDEENDPASIQSLLEAFPKDQLIELLRDAAVANQNVLEQVRQAADVDPAHRKVFVHGLGWDTTTEVLTAAFSGFGEIEDLKVVMDKNTGKCKGYGFVLFRRRSGAKNALKEPQKKIGNRMAACQLASLGPIPAANTAAPTGQSPAVSEYTQRKIFVSNVGPDVDPQKLLQFFAKYGEIEEGPLGLDKATGKPKGFALFVYKSVESAKKALQEPHKKFEGEVLHCQRAIDGPRPGKPGFTKNSGPGFQGRNNQNQVYGGGVTGAQVVAPAGMPGPGQGHLIAPAGTTVQVPAPAVAAPGLNPALGQALTAFLATQLGALGQGGAGVGQGPPQGYGYGAPGGPYGGPPQGGPGRGGGGYMGGI